MAGLVSLGTQVQADVAELEERERSLAEEGGYVLFLAAPGSVDPAECEDVASSNSAIEDAVWLRRDSTVAVDLDALASVWSFGSTSEHRDRIGWLLGPELEIAAWAPGDLVALSSDRSTTSRVAAGLIPAWPIHFGLGRAVLNPDSDVGLFDECRLSVHPAAYADARESISSAFSSVDEQPVFQERVRRSASSIDLASAFRGRGSRLAWLLGAITVAGLSAMCSWSRRSYASVYRSLGLSSSAAAMVIWGEQAVLLAVAGSLTQMALIAGWAGAPTLIALKHCAAALYAGALIGMLVALAVVRGSALEALKDT